MRFTPVLVAGALGVLLNPAVPPAFGQNPAPPDTVHVLRLDALLAELDANNPSLRAARLETDALGTRGPQVSSLPPPSVMLTYLPVPVVTARGSQRTQWRVEQNLPYPGKRSLRGAIADLSADVAGLEAATYGLDLQLQVKHLYYELYRIQEQDRLIRTFQAQLSDFEDVAATRYEVGVGSQQAILKAQVEQNRLDIRLAQLAEERRGALDALARLIHRPPGALQDAGVRLAAPPPPIAADTLPALALGRRPEIRALRTAGDRADRRIDLARRDFRPDFMVSLTYFDIADGDVPASADGRDAVGVGIGLKVPLDRARLRAALEEATLEKHRVEARLDALASDIDTRIDDLVHRLARQQEQLDLFRRTLLPQAETMLESTLSAYNTARTDFLDLLDAQRTLFTLRLDEAATQARHRQTLAALERALGVTSLTDL